MLQSHSANTGYMQFFVQQVITTEPSAGIV